MGGGNDLHSLVSDSPVFRLDRISRGGDHSPYVSLGDPGLRYTERLENYKRQHLPTDDFAHVNFGYVANVARLNASVVGDARQRSRASRRTRSSRSGIGRAEVDDHLGQVPGAAGYEVLIRRTTAPTYEKIYQAGSAASFLLPDQLDDGWAAVRSVGANGHRSLTGAVPPPCRRSRRGGFRCRGRSHQELHSRAGPLTASGGEQEQDVFLRPLSARMAPIVVQRRYNRLS